MNEDSRVEELLNRIKELEQTVRTLKTDLIHDSLTGIKTRAFFEEEAGTYFNIVMNQANTRRKEGFGFKNLSFAFFDIDHFKSINDTYGHFAGDGVLRVVAQRIEEEIRTEDIAARWGGEEIAVALIGAGEKDAKAKAEKIRKSIERISFNSVPGLYVTISGGVASADGEVGFEELISRADKAMYASKQGGRNKVTAYSEIAEGQNNI